MGKLFEKLFGCSFWVTHTIPTVPKHFWIRPWICCEIRLNLENIDISINEDDFKLFFSLHLSIYKNCFEQKLRSLSKFWWTNLNPLSTNLTKWSHMFKQFVGKLPTNFLNVFDHFVGLALKELKIFGKIKS